MGQKYNVDNLTSRFIKALLWDTYVPTVDIWRPGKDLIQGFTYITFDKYIVVAKKDYKVINIYLGQFNNWGEALSYATNVYGGWYNNMYATILRDGEIYYCYYVSGDPYAHYSKKASDCLGPQSYADSDYFEIIQPYVEDKFYRGITTNFQSTSSLYDDYTHYMLGQYLRMLRDIHDLDLMSYYNCYSGKVSNTIRLKKEFNTDNNTFKPDIIVSNNEINDGLLTYIVPIKFNKDYTIYYNSNIPFIIKPAYYDDITIKELNKGSSSTEFIQSTQVSGCSLDNPYVFKSISYQGASFITSDAKSKLLEDYLVLLIQVPNNGSPIIVLEGNYSRVKYNLIDDIYSSPRVFLNDLEQLSNEELNKELITFPSLCFNTNETYAFSDRLLEYLLYAPIIRKDRIKDNIKRVQKYLSSDKALKVFGKKYESSYIKDIWDNNLRYFIYSLVTQQDKNPLFLDINGFVDKDSEQIIDKAKVDGGNLNV